MGIKSFRSSVHRNKITYKQAKIVIQVAVILGIVTSLIQILDDFRSRTVNLDHSVNELLEILDQPVSFAAYHKDKAYAGDLLVGIFNRKSIYRVTIADPNGDVISEKTGGLVQGVFRPVSDFFFNPTKTYRFPLKFQPTPTDFQQIGMIADAGTIEIEVDTFISGAEFIKNSIWLIIIGLLRNLLFAVLLLIIFYIYLAKPFRRLEGQLQSINVEHPERTRLEVLDGHDEDEFALIVNSTNRLLEKLQNNMEVRLSQTAESEHLKGELKERERREVEMRKYQLQLEDSNREFKEILRDLRETQKQLVQAEKMAALGQLVAGVAHEINTPIGVSVTSASFLAEKMEEIEKSFKAGQLSTKLFEDFINYGSETAGLILNNLNRASELVKSFKEVAVDQTSDVEREIFVRNYLDEILLSLSPKLKDVNPEIQIDCDSTLFIKCYAGAFFQIFVNLINNSLLHGFVPNQPAIIRISALVENDSLVLTYSDNGKGIPTEDLDNIFLPFFTTNRGQGGMGLGLHIVYNLVTQKLKGLIECSSQPNEGATFKVMMPIQ